MRYKSFETFKISKNGDNQNEKYLLFLKPLKLTWKLSHGDPGLKLIPPSGNPYKWANSLVLLHVFVSLPFWQANSHNFLLSICGIIWDVKKHSVIFHNKQIEPAHSPLMHNCVPDWFGKHEKEKPWKTLSITYRYYTWSCHHEASVQDIPVSFHCNNYSTNTRFPLYTWRDSGQERRSKSHFGNTDPDWDCIEYEHDVYILWQLHSNSSHVRLWRVDNNNYPDTLHRWNRNHIPRHFRQFCCRKMLLQTLGSNSFSYSLLWHLRHWKYFVRNTSKICYCSADHHLWR